MTRRAALPVRPQVNALLQQVGQSAKLAPLREVVSAGPNGPLGDTEAVLKHYTAMCVAATAGGVAQQPQAFALQQALHRYGGDVEAAVVAVAVVVRISTEHC